MEEYIYVDKNGKAKKASHKHKYWYKYNFALVVGKETVIKTYSGKTWLVRQAREKYYDIWSELRKRAEISNIILLNKKIDKIY